MNKILVTGGTGFIGSNFIKSLDRKDFDITSVSLSSKVEGVNNLNLDLNNTDYSFLADIEPDFIVCLGSISSPKQSVGREEECFASNLVSVHKMLEKVVASGLKPKKIILMSSAVMYRDQNKDSYSEEDTVDRDRDIYTFSKHLSEEVAEYYREKYAFPVSVFRLSNGYGPGQHWDKSPNLIPSLFKQALINKKIEVFNTSPLRDFIFIDDIVRVLTSELDVQESGLFNLGTGVGTTVGEVVSTIADLTNTEVVDLNKPVSPPYKVVLDVSKLQKHLGFSPTISVSEGLQKSLAYYQSLI